MIAIRVQIKSVKLKNTRNVTAKNKDNTVTSATQNGVTRSQPQKTSSLAGFAF